jgi:tetratricopeptide (TPR) repeat protein
MSPEQCRGTAITLATDSYSFGVLAYHVLAGEPPFSGDALELALHHLNDVPVPPSKRCTELTDRVDRVVLALLAKDPADRPSSLVGAVDAIVGDAPLPTAPRGRRTVRSMWLAIGVIGAVGIAGTVIVRGYASSADDTTDECAPATERLATIWDPPTRDAIAARFAAVSRVDVASTWHHLSEDLDAYAARWSTLWEHACHPSNRKAEEPLLHAQRLTCLENALLELRGTSKSLMAIDVSGFAHATDRYELASANAALDGCANDVVLREQRSPPPPAVRDEVTRLAVEFAIVGKQLVAGGTGAETVDFDDALARMETIADRLEAVGVPSAAETSSRASFLVYRAHGDLARVEPARAAIADAIRRAERAHADALLAGIYTERGRLELGLANGDTKAIEDALERGEAALRRSGQPGALDVLRAELDIRAGRLDHAVELLRRDLAQPVRWLLTAARTSWWASSENVRILLIDLLARLGRHDEAIAEARDAAAAADRAMGNHLSSFWAHRVLEQTLLRAGRVAEALTEANREISILVAIQGQPVMIQRVHARRMAYALQLGRREVVDEARAAAIASGATEIEIVRGAASRGSLELAKLELDRMAAVKSSDETDEALAILAFETGDLASMKQHADRVRIGAKLDPSNTILGDPAAPTAWWLVAIADAAAGRRAAAELRLATLARYHEASDPGVAIGSTFNDGLVLAALSRWQDARTAFERARSMPNVWVRDVNLAEIDAWLGLARLEVGDPTAALQPLEECLDLLMSSAAKNAGTATDGFAYFAPIAELGLARALWSTSGDKARARYLAGQARDHFARLGPFKDRDRQTAIRWLEEHSNS